MLFHVKIGYYTNKSFHFDLDFQSYNILCRADKLENFTRCAICSVSFSRVITHAPRALRDGAPNRSLATTHLCGLYTNMWRKKSLGHYQVTVPRGTE